MDNNEKSKEELLKKIVLMNLETMPLNYRLSIGNEGFFDRNQLIEHVNKNDKIGKQILDSELKFMQSISRGEITRALASI
jgi:hypothetical protein